MNWERTAYLEGAIDKYQAEYRLRCKDGSWLWIQSFGKVNATDGQGKPTRMAGIHTDINLRKRAELDLDRLRHAVAPGAEKLPAGHDHRATGPPGVDFRAAGFVVTPEAIGHAAIYAG